MTDDLADDLVDITPGRTSVPPAIPVARASFASHSIEGEVLRVPGVVGAASFSINPTDDASRVRRVAVLQIADDVNASSSDLLRHIADAVDRTLLPWDIYVTKFALPRTEAGAVDVAAMQRRIARLSADDIDDDVPAVSPPRSRLPAAAIGLVAGLGLAVGGSMLLNSDDETTSAPAPSLVASPVSPTVAPSATAVPTEAVAVSTSPPVTDPPPTSPAATDPVLTRPAPLGVVALADGFEGVDIEPVVAPDSGGQWYAPDFYTYDGQAFYGPQVEDSPPVFALYDVEKPLAEFSVEFPALRAGAGLVFAYFDDKNYVSVVAGRQGAGWTVTEYTDGSSRTLAEFADSAVGDGAALRIEHDAGGFTLFNGRVELGRVDRPFAASPTVVGLVGSGPQINQIRWDNVSVVAAP